MVWSQDLKLLWIVSRPEFIPANSASLIIGIAWALRTPLNLTEMILLAGLAYIVLSLVAAFAAQINTLSDLEYDRRDPAKLLLIRAMDTLGEKKIWGTMIGELALSLIFLVILYNIQGNPCLFLFWVAGVFFAYTYSAPPLRFKSRSWLAMVVLLLVLSIIPISFLFVVLKGTIQHAFLIFLAGQALTVYAIIIPAEIRDYFLDKKRGIVTLTVQLGLVQASWLAIALLSTGGLLCGIGFLLDFLYLGTGWYALSLLLMALVYGLVLHQYVRLYRLSRSLSEKGSRGVDQQIVALASHNPKWITAVSQSIVIVCVIQIIVKILFV